MVRVSLAVALLLPMAEVAHAQLAANCTQALQYGTLAACIGGGTVRVTPASGKVFTSGCAVVMGSPKQAKCTVKSFATNGSLQIKVSAKTVNITGPGTMPVNQFNIGTVAGGSTKTYTSLALTATPLAFGVGGEVTLSGGQAFGNYSGNVIMTVIFTP